MAGLPLSCLQEVITCFLDSLNEKDDVLQKEITNIFLSVSKTYTSFIIEKFLEYIDTHKMSSNHKAAVYFELDCVCQSNLLSVNEHLLQKLVHKMCDEMISREDHQGGFQKSASGILVSIGCVNTALVMDKLFTVFQPGCVPHNHTIRTLGLLSWKNVFGMIPFLKPILGTSLSILSLVKKDDTKWAFCEAYGHFCSAVLEYVENLDKAPDKSVTKSCFSVEMNVTFDMMITWLHCKDQALQLHVVEAISYVFVLLSPEKLFDNSGKLIGILTGLLKKHYDCHVLSNALAVVLDTLSKLHPEILLQHFDQLVSILFNQVSHPVDYSNPKSVKNHAEVLRCFDFLVKMDSSVVLNFVSTKLNSSQEKNRIGSLILIKHILNSSQEEIQPHVGVLLRTLHDHLGETSNKVQKCVCQVIASLAQHNLLDSEENFCFIEFVVKLCAIPPSDDESSKVTGPDDVTSADLQSLGTRILYLVSSTVTAMHHVLWPKLLEYFVNNEHISALPALCKCLNQVITKLEEEDKFVFPALGQDKYPSREQLFVRLFVLTGCPLRTSSGVQEREFFIKLSEKIQANLGEVIRGRDCASPTLDDRSLLTVIRDGRSALYLDMLDAMVESFDDSFVELITEEMMSQGESFKVIYPSQRGFITKCLGCLSTRIVSKPLLNKVLVYIFHDVRHGLYRYREDCSFAVSQASIKNFPAVKAVVEDLVKSCLSRKMPQFLNFMKDKKDDDEAVKVMLLKALADIVDRCLTKLAPEEVQDCLEKCFIPICMSVKETGYFPSVLRSIQQLASTYLRQEGDTPILGRTLRLEFLLIAQRYLCNHTELPRVQNHALLTSSELIKLKPPLEYLTFSKVITSMLDSVLPQAELKKPSDNDLEVLLTNCMDLLSSVLLHEVTPSVLDEIMDLIYPWYHKSDGVQLAVLRLSHNLFQKYFDNLQFSVETPNSFSRSGHHLGMLIPYCIDPNPSVQHFAILSIYLILKILARYEGYARDHDDPSLDALLGFLGDINNSGSEAPESVAEIGKIISRKLPATQLVDFLDIVFECLSDLEEQNGIISAIIVKQIFGAKHAELQGSTSVLIERIHAEFPNLTVAVQEPLLECVVVLTRQNMTLAMDILLKSPLPLDDFVSQCWRQLRKEEALFVNIIEHFLDVLRTVGLYEEQRDVRTPAQHFRIASLLPISIICSLNCLLQGEGNQHVVDKEFCRLFATLLAVQSCYLGVCAPASRPEGNSGPGMKKTPNYSIVPNRDAYRLSPMQLARDCLRTFLLCCRCDAAVSEMDTYSLDWSKLEDLEVYSSVISRVVSRLIHEQPQCLSKLIPEVIPYLNSIYEGQRVMSAAIMTELVKQNCRGNVGLLDSLCNHLLSKIVDSSPIVRKLGFEGLGLTGQLLQNKEEMAESVFTAFINGIDDREDPHGMVTIHAMKGLSILHHSLKKELIRDNLSTIAYRVRPYFDKDNHELRQRSFQLLGDIAKYADQEANPEYVDHVINSLPAFLVHLNDEDEQVSQACKASMINVSRVLNVKVANVLSDCLVKSSEVDPDIFYPRLTKALVEELPNKLNLFISSFSGYCQSRWSKVQMSAALILSHLISICGPVDVDPNQIIMSIVLLLREPDRQVKLSAVKSINHLHFTQ